MHFGCHKYDIIEFGEYMNNKLRPMRWMSLKQLLSRCSTSYNVWYIYKSNSTRLTNHVRTHCDKNEIKVTKSQFFQGK